MRRAFLQSTWVCLALVLTGHTAQALTWELGIRGLGTGMVIDIRNTTTGALVGTFTSHGPAAAGVNFAISFDGATGADSDVQLSPEVQYTFVFRNWSNKAAYVEGHLPPGLPRYDDVYDIGINPDRLTLDTTFGDGVQEMWGFPTATYFIPLDLSLVIYETTPIGDKTVYKMRGTASGGNGSYTFSWTQATMNTSPTTNPSLALRTCLNSQHVTVTCTVNGTLTKSVVIGGPPNPLRSPEDGSGDDSSPSATPSTWSIVKKMYSR